MSRDFRSGLARECSRSRDARFKGRSLDRTGDRDLRGHWRARSLGAIIREFAEQFMADHVMADFDGAGVARVGAAVSS